MGKHFVVLFLVLFAHICVISAFDINSALQEFNEELHGRCLAKDVSEDCMGFCTYNMTQSFSAKNLKTLNPGWFLISSILPGKCYVDQLGKVFPALIDFRSTEQCCNEHRNGNAYSSKVQKFLEVVKFNRMPTIKQLKEEPEHCVAKACSGNTFDMKVRDIVACENTFIMSIMCYVSQRYSLVTSTLGPDPFEPENIKKTLAKLPDLIKTPEGQEMLKSPAFQATLKTEAKKHEVEITNVLKANPDLLKKAQNTPQLFNILKDAININQLPITMLGRSNQF